MIRAAAPATLLASTLTLASSGCAPSSPPIPAATQATFSEGRMILAELRRRSPHGAFVENVRVTMKEPRSGRTIEARGAVAVEPRHAMRLVLLGPGGATALDVWVTRDAWRFAVPSLDVVRHSQDGDTDDDKAAGFPIGFFRWWFLEPLDGKLLTAFDLPLSEEDRKYATALHYLVLRKDESTVGLKIADTPRGRLYFATRRTVGQRSVDHLHWASHAFSPEPGLGASYTQTGTGIRVDIEVESISPDEPDPAAFLDPDHGGQAL
ncbi:MAG TPA: hypothetical protein VF407_21985 [Polyangiaceae bacterium]